LLAAFDAPPERVVVIGPSSAESLAWLGLQDSVVGVSDYCAERTLAERPRVGGQLDPNLERIAALQPDLIVVQGAHPKVETWANNAAVAYLPLKTQSVAAWQAEVIFYGELFGCQALAAQQLEEWSSQLEQLKLQASALTEQASPPRALLIASRDQNRIARVLAAGRGSYLGELLELAGGQNIFADQQADYFDLAEESLHEQGPEVILELGGEQSDAQRLQVWRESFAQLPAVQHQRVHGLSDPAVFRPGPSMLSTAQQLHALLWPKQ